MAISCRAVVFDFGGVLWDMRWDVARELDRAHDLPRASVFETLYRCAACVFVDDLGQNVEAARAIGMRAVLYRVDTGDDPRARLEALGVMRRR